MCLPLHRRETEAEVAGFCSEPRGLESAQFDLKAGLPRCLRVKWWGTAQSHVVESAQLDLEAGLPRGPHTAVLLGFVYVFLG